MEYVLTTDALTKTYRHSRAVDGVSMHVARGEIYGFVGRISAMRRLTEELLAYSVAASDETEPVLAEVDVAASLDEVSAKRLFDRFFTVENARGSAGLGLSIAKLFVEKMGGSIGASWAAGRLVIRIRL